MDHYRFVAACLFFGLQIIAPAALLCFCFHGSSYPKYLSCSLIFRLKKRVSEFLIKEEGGVKLSLNIHFILRVSAFSIKDEGLQKNTTLNVNYHISDKRVRVHN
jgi:hypothetical protein